MFRSESNLNVRILEIESVWVDVLVVSELAAEHAPSIIAVETIHSGLAGNIYIYIYIHMIQAFRPSGPPPYHGMVSKLQGGGRSGMYALKKIEMQRFLQ